MESVGSVPIQVLAAYLARDYGTSIESFNGEGRSLLLNNMCFADLVVHHAIAHLGASLESPNPASRAIVEKLIPKNENLNWFLKRPSTLISNLKLSMQLAAQLGLPTYAAALYRGSTVFEFEDGKFAADSKTEEGPICSIFETEAGADIVADAKTLQEFKNFIGPLAMWHAPRTVISRWSATAAMTLGGASIDESY